jgi:hypothetical protein
VVVWEEEETAEEVIGLDGEDSGVFATGEVVEAGISMEFIFQ